MEQSIAPQPTIFLPSIKNGKKRPAHKIATLHFGVSEASRDLLVAGTFVGDSLSSERLVIPDASVYAGYCALFSDGTLRVINWNTLTYMGTLVDA